MQYLHYLLAIIFLLFPNISKAEIISDTAQEKNFGEWKVICEMDQMMNSNYCKIAAKFNSETSVISIEPSSKLTNQMILVIPNIKIGSFVKLRVDKNDIILSDLVKQSDFGMISLKPEQKTILIKQMKNGDFLFIRFNINGSDKELTARLNLKDFRSALFSINNSKN